MKKLPKAIPELNGGLFVPKQVVDLIERVLDDHQGLLERAPSPRDQLALLEVKDLLGLEPFGTVLPSAADQLDIPDPAVERLARNLLKI
jgi:hypothetical protein